MFDRPRVVCTSGRRRLSSRIASIVAMPSFLDSSWPVQMVKVRVSMRMSDSWMPQFVREVLDQPLGDGDLVLDGSGLAFFVDGQRDQCGAVLLGELRDLREARLRAVTVLVVHRVDDRSATELLQPGADHGDLGGVEHDRQRRGGGEAAGQLLHVGDTVAAHVVDAQVEHVRALADLVAGHLHTVVPAAVQHGLAELLRAVGVRPLTDRHVGGVLTERHRLVERGGAGLGARARARPGSGPVRARRPGAGAPASCRSSRRSGRGRTRVRRSPGRRPARGPSAGSGRRSCRGPGRPAFGMQDSGTREWRAR